MCRQPNLQTDSKNLLDLYANNMAVTAKDIEKCFKVSSSTAFKVVECAYEYARKNGRKIYAPPTRKIIPTDLLFEMYNWDIKSLTARVRILNKNF